MPRLLRLPLLVLPALLIACGGDAQAPAPDTADTGTPAPVTETTDAAPADAAEAPEAPGGDAFTPPALTPADISAEAPISVVALRDAVLAPYGKSVTVYGYAHGEPSSVNGKVRISRFLALAAEPGQGADEAALVRCDLAEAPAERRVEPGTLIAVRGAVGAPNGGAMRLEDGCEIVAMGQRPEGAVSAQALWDAMLGWVGTGVAVTGRYNGTTTSELASGTRTTVRLEAPGTEGLNEQVATCVMAGEVPEAASQHRDGVLLHGVVTENWVLAFDRTVASSRIELADCRFVNR